MKSFNTINMTRLACVFLIILITSCSKNKDPFQPIRVDFLFDQLYLMHSNNIDNLHTVVLKGKFNDLLPGSVVDSVYYDYEKNMYFEDIHSFMCCRNTCQFNEYGLPRYFKEHTDFTVEKEYTWARNGNVIYQIINTKYSGETDSIFYYLEDGLLKTKLEKRFSKTDYYYKNNYLSKKIKTELTPVHCDTTEIITEEYVYWNESGKIKSIIRSYKLFDHVNHLTFDKTGFPKYAYYLEKSDTLCVLEIKKSEL